MVHHPVDLAIDPVESGYSWTPIPLIMMIARSEAAEPLVLRHADSGTGALDRLVVRIHVVDTLVLKSLFA